MQPHAPKGQRTLFDVGCTKRARTAVDGQRTELRTCLVQDTDDESMEEGTTTDPMEMD